MPASAFARSSGASAQANSPVAGSSFPFLQLNITPAEIVFDPIDDGRTSAHSAIAFESGKIRFPCPGGKICLRVKAAPGRGERFRFRGVLEIKVMGKTITKTHQATNKIINAWTTLAPTATFAGMTLAQYSGKVQPTFDTRTAIDKLDAQTTSALDARDAADMVTTQVNQLVVNAVKGDPTHGEDSDLYEAMGYVRKSARKSGLTRKKAVIAAAAK
jgi:hypothetical protein